MRPLRLILALAAAAYAASQYWQERRRFAGLRALSGRDALARHERARKRSERTMTLIAAVICFVAAALAVYAFAVLPTPITKGN